MSDTASAVSLSSSTPQRQLISINNLLLKSVTRMFHSQQRVLTVSFCLVGDDQYWCRKKYHTHSHLNSP
ncbi:hypothetical protein EXE47_11370 [Halorubrum sp. GN12_10-3_MGM]|nr:hypothetical protein EXE47_11370 [Halorubrum sp. GN12_10-3_MGM]